MSNEPTRPSTGHNNALVLGGGGSAGNAWLIGVIAGLFENGLDVTKADLIIGTSAGSTAAVQITTASPAGQYAATIAPLPAGARPAGPGPAQPRPASNQNHIERLQAIVAGSSDAADMRRKLGAAALEMEAASDGSWSAGWRTIVAKRLPSQHWPRQKICITAVDAGTGEPVAFNRHSGVELVDAVAASCSSNLPYTIGDRKYIDGGFRSNAENADLAAGYARVLVLAPFSGRSLQPPQWGTDLATQIDKLRTRGSRVETIFPEDNARDIFAPGGNVMSPATRLPAAQAGYDQGKTLAARLADFWR
jgi:NTE family protein